MNYQILIPLVCIFITLVSSVRIPPNPCPQIFSYYKDRSGQLYGEAIIPYDRSTTMQFSVNASLAALFQKAELRLVLVTTLNELQRAERVVYNVFFPSQEIIPKITQITYNGNVLCRGPPEPLIPGISGITNIWYTTIFKYTRRPFIPTTNQVNEDLGTSDADIPVKDPGFQMPSRIPNIPRPVQNPNVIGPVEIPRPVQNPNIIRPDEFSRPAQNPNSLQPVLIAPIPSVDSHAEPESMKDPKPNTLRPIENEFLNPVTQAPIKTNKDFQCGISNSLVVPLILGGSNVEEGEYPWLTALFALSGDGNYEYKCSATLISEKHVITAGRCVQYYKIQVVKTEDILLVMGTSDLKQWSSNGAITRKARTVDTHPDFKKNPNSAHADLSVITMDVPVKFSNVLKPVCLWKGDTDLYPITNMMGTITGFGQDEDAQKNGDLHVIKARHTEIPIVSQYDCLLSSIAFNGITSDKTFCAGGKGSGPCIGDSGAGLVLPIDGVYYLRGIASLSSGKNGTCDYQDKYAVFCDVAKFMDWVKSCMTN
nr:serine protease gd-like isoform X2 [Leptinotarsa decemlineata]